MLHAISYRSRAVVDINAAVFKDIESVAQRRNAELDVTGALVFDGTYFFQTIEGSADAVTAIMRSIQRDPRHTDIIPFGIRKIEKRMFSQWRMKTLRAPQSANSLLSNFGYLDLRDPVVIDDINAALQVA